LLLLAGVVPGFAQADKAPTTEALRAGRNYIATPVYTEAADRDILALFKGLRVSDVVDGLDAVGLVDT
jgi:hypothetical protein